MLWLCLSFLAASLPSIQTGIRFQGQQACLRPEAPLPMPHTALPLSSSPGWTVREAY